MYPASIQFTNDSFHQQHIGIAEDFNANTIAITAGPSSAFGCPSCWGGCPSFLPSLPTCVMYSIGCLYLSRYSIASLQWSPVVSLAASPLTSASSAAQCRFWLHVGCCVLLRGVSVWSLVPAWLLCSEGPFRLWVHQHGMISPLSCISC